MTDQAISQTAVLFSRYIKLESEWKDVTKIPKDVLRQFYTEQYKPKYKIDNPGCNIVNFAGLFRVIIFWNLSSWNYSKILHDNKFRTLKYLYDISNPVCVWEMNGSLVWTVKLNLTTKPGKSNGIRHVEKVFTDLTSHEDKTFLKHY